ncbi:hypothetical protein [Mesorhizobium sp. CA5]|uniref:hypothetical protein n=1 Tax=Mesorhizobium sp. CA5 TaxID=2876638 RepID=UPI001CD07CE9|nr:hypothetical protein [Mesorhizobium sp. CA5]MBZ9845651.1 hypothetical protein [Mesorhizobium sp. CA5]
MPKAAQLLIGIIIVAGACWVGAYTGAAITVITMGFLGGVGELVSVILPLLAAAFVFWRGTRSGKPGYQWAPLVFFVGWALVSVAMRGYLTLEAAKVTSPAIDPDLAKIKTLVVDDFLNTSRTFVSEGVVDQLVEIAHKDNNPANPISSVRQTTLASGPECTDEDMARSAQLRAVGRTDECFKQTMLPAVPDGLRILHPADYHWGPSQPGKLTAVVADNGRETEVLQWRRNSARVPAYLPLFRMGMGSFDQAQTIWETHSGPFEVVNYGDVDLTPQAMAAAIYRFDPSLPPKPKTAHPAVLAEQAFALASRGDLSAALNIVALLDRKNYLDDNMVKAAAYAIFKIKSDIAGGRLPRLDKFADKLNVRQRNLLNDEIIRILTTPATCRCRAFLFSSADLGQRAIDAFQNTSDLEQWQYDGLLTATMYVATPFREHRQKLFASIMASHDPSNGRRLVSYARMAGLTLLDAEMRALMSKLPELRGEELFLLAVDVRLPSPAQAARFSSTYDPQLNVHSDTWRAFWGAMRSQASRIPDDKQRLRALDEIGKRQAES